MDVTEPEIIAIGLLTQRDLERLGQSFNRAWPIDDASCFDELLRAIDEAERRSAAHQPMPGPASKSSA